MSAVKHTPGPWRINGLEINPHTIHHVGGCLATCTLPYPYEQLTWEGHTVYETEANARLIAAAPELLEALKDCLESLKRCQDEPKLSGSPAYRITCIRQAKAAIAKAEGGKP